MSDKYNQIEQLKRLLDSGALTEEEFQTEKAKVLGHHSQEPPPPHNPTPHNPPPHNPTPHNPTPHNPTPYAPPSHAGANHWGMEQNTFCMLMHLSQFAGVILPVVGYVLPIVMWATEKNKSATIDAHGKNLLNFLISYTIYFIASLVLSFILIGIPVLIALMIVSIVFPIIAGIKANNGAFWKYPLCIPFFSQ